MTVGRTKDAGWQIGVSRTLDQPLERVWSTVVDHPDLWLGPGARLPHEAGELWRAHDGTAGELRSRREHRRLRLTLQPPGEAETTVQVTVTAAGDRTVLRFHQERMRGPAERAAQRAHWQQVMDRVAAALAG